MTISADFDRLGEVAGHPHRHWNFLLQGWSLSFGTSGQISVGGNNPSRLMRACHLLLRWRKEAIS